MDREVVPYSLLSEGKEGRDKTTRATMTAILVAVSASHSESYFVTFETPGDFRESTK